MKDNHLMALLLAILTLTNAANGILVMDEDKRQGLIPFPRVGRTNELRTTLLGQALSPLFIPPPAPPSPYYGQGEVIETSDPFAGASDVFVRFSRKDRTFIPRLGRRKRSLSYDELYKNFNMNNKMMELSELLRKSPWTVITLRGVDKKMALSPRLGRAMVPRLGRKRSDEEVDKRTAFVPRLGHSHQGLDDGGSDRNILNGHEDTNKQSRANLFPSPLMQQQQHN